MHVFIEIMGLACFVEIKSFRAFDKRIKLTVNIV